MPPPFGSRPAAARADFDLAHDVLIENKTFRGTQAGLAAMRFFSCRNVLVRECDFIDVPGGIFATLTTDLTLADCRYRNITGPHARTGANVGNLIQTDRCTTVRVQRNKGKGGDTEDIVSFYQSSDAIAEDNHFEGIDWSSPSGSGIALGDLGGTGNIARHNIIVNPGVVGAFIAGGTNHSLLDNIIIGEQRPLSNVGLYVWDQSGLPCSGHTWSGNRILWKNAAGADSPYWDGGNCGPIAGTNVVNDTTLDIEQYRVHLDGGLGMSVKILRARKMSDRYAFVVHLDSTKLIDGQPDPRWIMRQEWPLTTGDEPTYVADLRAKLKVLAEVEIARLQGVGQVGGTALPLEGQDLT